MSKESQRYDSGYAATYQAWIGQYAGKSYNYFARHKTGNPLKYEFNSLGYRGPEHCTTPDISVFGSSFSFGVGIEFDQCWHQQLGEYFVNCYAPAGFAVTNNDIIDHYHREKINTGIVILQLREFSYNTAPVVIPNDVHCFVVDSYLHNDLFGFDWASFVDKSKDQVHPGPLTHALWAKKIKQMFNL